MNWREIRMEQDPRRAQFHYFRNFSNPYVGVTENVDITELMKRKELGESLFLLILYAVSQAANRVPELRRRIRGETVVEYAWCPTSHTVALDNGSYGYCQLTAEMELEKFLPMAAAAQEAAKRAPSLEDGNDAESLLFLSCMPWLHYTALVQPVPSPADSNPRISWGKYLEQSGRFLLPVTLLANHALVDGIHIARFYKELDQVLEEISREK